MALKRYSIYDKHILLDTGVLNNVFQAKAPHKEEVFWKALHSRNYYNKREPFFISTSLMGIEALSYNLGDLDPYVIDGTFKAKIDRLLSSITEQDCDAKLGVLGEEFYNWFLGRNELQLAEMIARHEKEICFRSPRSRNLVRMIIGDRLTSPERHRGFIRDLSFDRIQALPYDTIIADEKVVKKIDYAFLYSSLLDLAGDRGTSSTRITDSLLARASVSKGGTPALTSAYQTNRDALDTEIVQLASGGHWQSDSQKLSGVVVLSTEKLNRWPPRIQRWTGALRYFSQIKSKSDKPLLIRPGLIFQVNAETGEIEDDVIDIYKDFDLTDLWCAQDNAWR